jgi:hypothetical protein
LQPEAAHSKSEAGAKVVIQRDKGERWPKIFPDGNTSATVAGVECLQKTLAKLASFKSKMSKFCEAHITLHPDFD